MRFAVSTIGLILFLTGCGGGGGGDTAVATSTPDPIVWVPAPVSPSTAVVATPATTPAKSPNCVVKPTGDTDKYRSAIMDMRFEQPMDFTADGKPVAGYEAVTRVIDKIDCVGFDTIVFQTNIPIDTATGKLELYDSRPGAWNPDKNIPKDFWRLV